ncbi:MAG: radical SAM protein [Myxococcales bacterium]|nr:radical SAM protein [Myxococcales bacterium]
MSKPRYVLGAVVSDHDSAVSLLADGRPVAAINEERLCRVRRGDPRNSLRRALNYVLAEAGIALADVDLIAADTAYYYPPAGHPPIALFPDFPDPARIVLLDHHLGHAAGAFLPSPFDEAAVLTVDASGGIAPLVPDRGRWGFVPGDLAFRARGYSAARRHPTAADLLAAEPAADARNYPAESLTLGHFVRGEVLVGLESRLAESSLGYLYAIGAHFLSMEEGSLMGLAGYGGPNEFDAAFAAILTLENGGGLRLNPDWLRFWSGDRVLEDPVSLSRLAPRWFETFGAARAPDEPITARDQQFAWSLQHRLEEALVHVAAHLFDQTQSPNLCVAGGVGLNSVANQKILAQTGFQNIFIQPAASDDGLALGFALFADYVLAGLPAEKQWTMRSAATGRTYGDAECGSFVDALAAGRLPVEYLAAIPETREVTVYYAVGEGAEQTAAMAYDPATRRWRAELPVPVGAAVRYRFVSRGAPIESYCLRATAAPRSETAAERHAPEFKKFLDDHRDLAGALDGERAFVGPEQVVIDPTNRCNNNCLPCWTNSPLLGEFGPPENWHRRQMPAPLLLGLIDELAALGTRRVRLTGGGEPLLHPAIFEAVEAIKRHGMIGALTTNFSAIDEAGVRRLAAAGLDELTVSLWAGTPAVYSRSHPNKTEATFARIERLLRLYCSLKGPGAEVILANVLFSMNYQETREMFDFARRVGADGAYFTLVDSVHLRTDGLLLTPPHLKVLEGHLDEIERRAAELAAAGERFRLDNWGGFRRRLRALGAARGEYDREAVEEIPCYVGWMFARVLPTGEVAPCCRGVNLPLGRLGERSFAEIWHGEPYREFRRMAAHESKRHPYFAAIGCHRTCDNLMHNREFHRRLTALTADEKAQLRRWIVGQEDG